MRHVHNDESALELQLEESNSDLGFDWREYLVGPRPSPNFRAKQVRIVDLFSSVGGLTSGVSAALAELGLLPRPCLAVDVDKKALDVYSENWPTAACLNVSVKHIVEFKVVGQLPNVKFAFPPVAALPQVGELKGTIDLLLAGPPCQGHSNLNNVSRGNDPRNELYLAVPALAVALEIPRVIIENVPGAVNDSLQVTQKAKRLFELAGYVVSDGVLSADKLGWPQTRKRYFMVASKIPGSLDLKYVEKRLQQSVRPISWLIEDLVDDVDESEPMLTSPNLTPENQRRIDVLFDLGIYELPLAERPECHQNGTTYSASYGRMKWDLPAPTLTTGLFSPGRGRFVHPIRRRMLTPREAARIQGFPDWYQFVPSQLGVGRSDLAKWIGDAVPSILGYTAAHAAFGKLNS
jgi:DNA (cytosine-5)-methyltransferase 1